MGHDTLPLASLRLLVPPFQLMTASMWQVLKKQDVMNYWKVAEFVSLVMDMAPELLMYKYRTQLNLGLRARVGLSSSKPVTCVMFMPILQMKEEEEVAGNFLELIQILVKDPEERRDFFLEVFPAEYGPQYDRDLQTLFWEFLCRLAQLLPVPDLEQTASWLGAECSVLEDCVHSVSEPTDLKNLLQHHKHLGNLEQHGESFPVTTTFVFQHSYEGTDGSTVAEGSLVVLPEETTREEEVGEGGGEVTQKVESGLINIIHPEVNRDDSASSQHKISVGPHDCPDCEKKFKFASSLITHKSGRKYECLICGELFKSLVAQREHKSTHMENGEYLCSECGRAFAWKSALVRHLKTHGEDADKAERSHKCPRCDLGFSCASYLNRHLQTHQEERVHSCNCGKSFAYRAALTAHQRIHQKERPHMCTQCGKGFLYKGGLLSHMKIHSEEMPFMCSFCGKSFKRERNMKKHERCHTRENVFSCSQCDKSFVYKATLIRHELTHSGERPYLCSDCGKGFFSHAELLKHERFHTGHKPFQCPHCGKRFTQSCYLTIHLRYHTGVRPYSCTECDKSFLSANRLKRHQRTHSGEKPYLCVECGKGFRQSYNLKMHQRTHIMKVT
uniref:C2H2-type domain-containing protein n=1 Tax=Seriola lalandi dorsalis TaxID=1841481 RepID=A0A3B4YNK8_SERLL